MFFPKRNKVIDQKIDSLNAKAFVSVPNISGLPVPEGTFCQLYYCEDKIVIDGCNTTFNLSLEKIKDISIKAETEIQRQIVSGAGGAVAGGMMFGALGALIGGRAKEHKIESTKVYLIITYESDGIKYMSFEVSGTPKSAIFVKLFQEEPKRETIVNL